MPSFIGATRPSTALAAIAASTALPPLSSTRAPICEASTLSVATIPAREATRDRDRERSSVGSLSGSASINAALHRSCARTMRSTVAAACNVKVYHLSDHHASLAQQLGAVPLNLISTTWPLLLGMAVLMLGAGLQGTLLGL